MLSSGVALNKMEHRVGGSSSAPGMARGPALGNASLLMPSRTAK